MLASSYLSDLVLLDLDPFFFLDLWVCLPDNNEEDDEVEEKEDEEEEDEDEDGSSLPLDDKLSPLLSTMAGLEAW